MNRGTIIMIALALGSLGLAWSSRPTEAAVASFADTGEPLFPGFTDAALASALEVVTWDDKAAKVVRFAVEQKQGRWVIPSHNDYPADGTERMGKAAASFIDVKKDIYYGDNAAEQGQFGVLDPGGDDGKGDEKGKHITIKDAAGAILVDVIVGKAVPDKQEYFYVRSPNEKRVYAARLELDISTNFTDWIEKDLLKVKRDELVAMLYDPYSVDEQNGRVMNSKPIRADLDKVDGKDEWIALPGVETPEGKTLDSAKVRQVVTAIASIKIVGVRPRPKPLTLQALQSKGFFVTPDQQRLFGNEGEARIVTKDGIVFSLYFGEITYESGLALTAGTAEEAAAEPAGDSDGGAAEAEKQANRYMFVEVAYDPSLDKGSDGVTAVEDPADPAAAEAEKDALKGEARAQMLQKRFGEWFYVISDASFKQIHKERDEMFKAPPVPKDGAKPPGGPAMEGGGPPAPGGAPPAGAEGVKPPKPPAKDKPKPAGKPTPPPAGDAPPSP
jgi:Domain of unknown function (DUF4340)